MTAPRWDPAATAIFLDVGSTNSRAWLVRDGEILVRETAPVGVRDSAREGSTTRVRETVRRLVASVSNGATVSAIAAAGMITSPLGLREVPHVDAPASAEDFARAATLDATWDDGASGLPILLVPGVRTTGRADRDALTADVMRGEETLAIGLLARGLLDPSSALVTASSHWKVSRVDEAGRVAGSRTSLGGELVHAVQSVTLLAVSLPEGPLASADPEWLDAGAAASRQHGLLRALFGVRLLDQQQSATAEQRLAWLLGACIAEDVDAIAAARVIEPGARVAVSGPAAVPEAWAHVLNRAGYRAAPLSAAVVEQAFVSGLDRILRLRDRFA